MEPGDIVIGQVMQMNDPCGQGALQSRSPRSYTNGYLVNDEISVYTHKEAYLLSVVNMGNLKIDEKFADYKKEKLHVSKVRGMVIDFDPMGSKRPHIDGLAAVLIEDKVWWVVAGDLKVVKLGQGRT